MLQTFHNYMRAYLIERIELMQLIAILASATGGLVLRKLMAV